MKRHIYSNSLYQFCFYFLLGVTIKKMVLFYFFFVCPRIEDVSDIKLIRTDTTLDLSQKAEKRSKKWF